MKEKLNHTIVPIEEKVSISEVLDNKNAKKMMRNLSGRFEFIPSGKGFNLVGRDFLEIKSDNDSAYVSFSSVGDSKIRDAQSINFISGTCLFGADGLVGVDAQGSRVSLTDPFAQPPAGKINEVEQFPFVHPSEVESVMRTTGALSILSENSKTTQQDMLTFHLPVPEYFMYLLAFKEMGALNPATTLELANMVINRGEAVAEMFANRIPGNIEVEFTSPLQSIAEMLLASGFEMSLDNIVMELSEKDELWGKLLANSPPEKVTEINYLSYSYLYHDVQARAKNNGMACLAVEESKESRILTEAKKQGRVMGQDITMNALYVAPRVVSLAGMHGKNDLFMHDTSQDSKLNQLKTVVRIYKGDI